MFTRALDFKGNLSLTMIRSVIDANNEVILVSSTGGGNSNPKMTLLEINVENTTMSSGSKNIIDINSCSTHVHGNLSSSVFIGNSQSVVFDINAKFINLSAAFNEFKGVRKAIYVGSCGAPIEEYPSLHQLNILGNRFEMVSETAIGIHGNVDNIEITNNTFVSNQKCFNPTSAMFDFKSLKITKNIFQDNHAADGVIRLSQPRSVKSTVEILQNTFEKNTGKVISFTSPNIKSTVEILQNTFESNTGTVISCMSPNIKSTVEILQNTFEKNTGTVISCMSPNIKSTVEILQNTFENNTGTVISFKSPNINIYKNFFDNENADYTLKVVPNTINYVGSIINASLNYWGTTDLNRISRQIYDHDYDESLLDVTFRPYLGSRNYSDIRNAENAFLSTSGEIGGSVNGEIKLTADDSPYLVASNIVVEEEDVLTLEGGVVLLFKEGHGIDVYGE
jgi:hypothetical protein